eukprot:Blabericola_migrator_1__7316@NODE_371_length_9275_cov_101_492615_g292_i1_p3_GENE_NODE_371_length_9275_cov_101_492615_g292_i1NODE_371_length_9275_cov_101_492615_g292_i1_p3_ORF_typecomplete_len194_score18_69_NODE_371_length_9275_cov_101_492615_g292_i117782359
MSPKIRTVIRDSRGGHEVQVDSKCDNEIRGDSTSSYSSKRFSSRRHAERLTNSSFASSSSSTCRCPSVHVLLDKPEGQDCCCSGHRAPSYQHHCCHGCGVQTTPQTVDGAAAVHHHHYYTTGGGGVSPGVAQNSHMYGYSTLGGIPMMAPPIVAPPMMASPMMGQPMMMGQARQQLYGTPTQLAIPIVQRLPR